MEGPGVSRDNVYHKPSLEESPPLWMLSKAKHIRVLEARGTSDVYIPSVKPRPGGEGRVVLRTQVGVLSGKDQASAAAPLSGGGRIALCLQGQWVWAEAPLLWKSHLKKKISFEEGHRPAAILLQKISIEP